MRYTDPSTGKRPEVSAKTTDRREAERKALAWELELRDGKYKLPSKTTWEEFRVRYEDERVVGLAKSTARKVSFSFGLVERIISPRLLRDVTAEKLSRWIVTIGDEGRAPATVSIYARALKASLNWAADMKLLDEAPKIREPKSAGGKLMKGRPIVLEEHERMLAAVPFVERNFQRLPRQSQAEHGPLPRAPGRSSTG